MFSQLSIVIFYVCPAQGTENTLRNISLRYVYNVLALNSLWCAIMMSPVCLMVPILYDFLSNIVLCFCESDDDGV